MEIVEKLRRVRIEGFRSLREIDLELRDLNVLIGANGSGKSNFVGFFNMLSFMLTGSLQTYVGRKGGATSILHYGAKKTPVLRGKLEFEGDGDTSEYGFSLAFASPDRLLFTDEQVEFWSPGKERPYSKTLGAGHFETNLLELASKAGDTVPRKVARVFVNRLKGLQVYHFHDTSETAYIRTLEDVDRNRSLMSNGGNLAAVLYRLQETKPSHYARILSTVRMAVPYLKDLILEPDPLNGSRIKLRWDDRNRDYEFGPHQLSDGSLRAIALITALLQPEDMLPAVILIDEPELGLHPNAVGIVASLIKSTSAKRQVIIATQSPRLLSQFSPEDVVVVERNEDESGLGESTFQRLSSEGLGEWLRDYDLGSLYEMNVTGGGPQ
jgi:predicted ATPase